MKVGMPERLDKSNRYSIQVKLDDPLTAPSSITFRGDSIPAWNGITISGEGFQRIVDAGILVEADRSVDGGTFVIEWTRSIDGKSGQYELPRELYVDRRLKTQ